MNKKTSYSDIYTTHPWQCGDPACAATGGWHLSNYWFYVTGKRVTYTVDKYADGDHDTCLKRDVPGYAQTHAAWLDYARWVIAHRGADPLNNYTPNRETAATHILTVGVRPSLIGAVIHSITLRRKGRKGVDLYIPTLAVSPDPVMKEVREFVQLERRGERWIVGQGTTWGELKEAYENKWRMKHGSFQIREELRIKTPRLERLIRRDIARIAKNTLKEG